MSYITQETAIKLYNAAEEEAIKLLDCVGECHPDLWEVEVHLFANAAIKHYIETSVSELTGESYSMDEAKCSNVLRQSGKPYPRTCQVCGLTSPCRFPAKVRS